MQNIVRLVPLFLRSKQPVYSMGFAHSLGAGKHHSSLLTSNATHLRLLAHPGREAESEIKLALVYLLRARELLTALHPRVFSEV